jgi:hypothetical protein
MNEELFIQDIYAIDSLKKNVDDINIDIHTLNFKPCEHIDFHLYRDQYTFILFKTENNNIYIEFTKIWNNRILLKENIYNYNLSFINKSCDNATLILYIVKYNKNKFKNISFMGCESNYNKEFEINNNNQCYIDITLYTRYCGASIITTIFLQCIKELHEKIIKIQSYNIINYYKVKLISKNNTHNYELTLCGIKNILTEEYIDITLKYDTIYDIMNVYNNALNKIYKFMEKNIDYINDNKIVLPKKILETDDYYNVFYYFNSIDFMKKYNIRVIDTYRYAFST